ncbi:MFS transporter [Afipia sp. P52-10]|jgi:predicted MFS family arabinose efflux permease|uniref:MFS transporter n=1 Tax=Afipia sp. P52-10 TaxID=1429916 RepID=UPI0003DF038D|nr:MFS transporter [Afipia sp. P52-10]ETR77176.1 MFS transporter [Afipia sp. P52-10]
MADLRALRPVWPILLGAALMLSLSLGLRQSLGLFAPQLTRDLAISMSDFTFAIAVQNLAWGVLQAVAGALVVKYGFRPLLLGGAALYVVGLALLASAQGFLLVLIGAGVCLGISMSCTASALANSVASRAVPAHVRSLVLGGVTAVGSLGSLLAAPLGQALAEGFGWRTGVIGFAILALGMLPAAWFASKVDAIPLPATSAHEIGGTSVGQALRAAATHAPFVVMACAYFVCGMQLVFLTTHLPSYLALCGMDPMLSAQALGAIGGFNILGSFFFGWAGQRWNKLALLGIIYISRSIVLTFYFIAPPTPTTTLIFASIMGFLWLGVSPLTAGAVAEMFGLRWQPMIQGIAFVSHQLGSCLGAFGGGVLYDALGSYTLAWQIGVSLGLTAGIVQIAFALWRPPSQSAVAMG